MDKWKREVGCIVVFIYIVEEQLFIAYHIHRFERKGDFAVFAKGRAPRWWERLGKTRGVPFSPPLYFRCDSAKKKKNKKNTENKIQSMPTTTISGRASNYFLEKKNIIFNFSYLIFFSVDVVELCIVFGLVSFVVDSGGIPHTQTHRRRCSFFSPPPPILSYTIFCCVFLDIQPRLSMLLLLSVDNWVRETDNKTTSVVQAKTLFLLSVHPITNKSKRITKENKFLMYYLPALLFFIEFWFFPWKSNRSVICNNKIFFSSFSRRQVQQHILSSQWKR